MPFVASLGITTVDHSKILGAIPRPPKHASKPRRDTKPELQVRSLLHREGLRYRVNTRPIREFDGPPISSSPE
jgi:G:T-mismatch repair DNA endonuclease (very short patch repair protein)